MRVYRARDGRRVAALSRIQIAQVSWRKPVAGMTTTVVVNCHMHHRAAKRDYGFVAGYERFFNTLAENIWSEKGRFVVGDWNMSLWVVVDELRQRRIECTIGAMFAWRLNSDDQVMCDSMGIFLCGPVTSVRVLLGPEIFQDGDETALLQLNAGAGYALSSYLPPGGPDKVRSSFHIRGCGERGPAMATDDWPELPAWTEKRAKLTCLTPRASCFVVAPTCHCSASWATAPGGRTQPLSAVSSGSANARARPR